MIELDIIINQIQEIENKIKKMFDEQFSGIEDEKMPFLVNPIPKEDFSQINNWFEDIKTGLFFEEVFSSIFDSINSRHLLQHSKLTKILSSRINQVMKKLQIALEIWNNFKDARLEINSIAYGGFHKDEVIKYIFSCRRYGENLVNEIDIIKDNLERINTLIQDLGRECIQKSIMNRCPITGQSCNKNIESDSSIVFVGYAFNSNYFNAESFKKAITESLKDYKLFPFFPDDHYEPAHLSCYICKKLQEASICVFEISDANSNVMFELGLACALGKVVILLCQNTSLGTKISDIAGINRIEYNDLFNCRDYIKNYFMELEGKNQLKTSTYKESV